MESNRTILQKVDMTLDTLRTTDGYIGEAPAKKFIQKMIAEAKLGKMIRTVPLDAPEQAVFPSLGFTNRIIYPSEPGRALSEAQRSSIDIDGVHMHAKPFKGEVRFPEEILEENIERGNFRTQLMNAIAKSVSRDSENLLIQSNTGAEDPWYRSIDGILVQARAHAFDGGGASLGSDLMEGMIRRMPKQYMGLKEKMVFATSVNAVLDYKRELRVRPTALGDMFFTGKGTEKVRFDNIPVEGFPLWPESGWQGEGQTNVLLTPVENMVWGIWKKIRFKTAEEATSDAIIIVFKLSFDIKYQEDDAVVRAYNIAN